jgi:hypothetical protein
MTTQIKTVLVLCTGNSCRSQMAEVILSHDLVGQVRALSAGTRPQPRVADGAIAALKDAGLPTAGLYPKDIDAVLDEPIDLVITVCDTAKESCPIFPRPGAPDSSSVPRPVPGATGVFCPGPRRHPRAARSLGGRGVGSCREVGVSYVRAV